MISTMLKMIAVNIVTPKPISNIVYHLSQPASFSFWKGVGVTTIWVPQVARQK
jgi:hypothetical protein